MPRFDITQASNKDAKAELRPGSNICQCDGYGLFFTGVQPFDRHLIGSGTDNPRCRSVKQMEPIGMKPNSNGVWMYGAPLKAQKKKTKL